MITEGKHIRKMIKANALFSLVLDNRSDCAYCYGIGNCSDKGLETTAARETRNLKWVYFK